MKKEPKPSKYWIDRALARTEELRKNETTLLKTVRNRYLDIMSEYRDKVGVFYQTYGTENIVTLTEALKPLAPKEQAELFKQIDSQLKKLGRDDRGFIAFLRNTRKLNQVPRITKLSFEAQKYGHELAMYNIAVMNKNLESTMRLSYAYQIKAIEEGLGIRKIGELTTAKLRNAVTRNWSGEMFSDRIWKQKDKLAATLQTEIQNNFIQNRHYKESIDNLMNRFDVNYSDAERLIRTETQRISNEADLQTYIDLGIEEYQFIAVDDERTSDVCRGYNNEIMSVSSAQIGVNFPPLHPNCRSTTVAYYG